MLAIERRNAILARLAADGKVIVASLSNEFDVTEETIRRDLEKLENEGLAKRTYGGAVKKDTFNTELPFQVRKQTNVEDKQEIALKIAAMVQDGDYLMLDASTTALYVVRNILEKKRITIITNSVEILIELAAKNDWNILSTGGTLKPGSLSFVGRQAENMLREFHVDLAVFSCKGIDMDHGATDSNERDTDIKKCMLSAAKKKILAVDSTKFDRTSFTRVCGLEDIDVVVTNREPSEKWQQYFKETHTELKF
ncbi:MAG: DeoR/GlpR transcriptional regulator [Clostridia bacterium]|nr:DeoR/GlpR transcriptional regulator [Clostridia bacterium]